MTPSDRRVQLVLFRLGQARIGVLASQIETLREHGRNIEARVAGTWIVLEDLDELLEVPLEAIRPFPALVEPFSLRSGLWGILAHRGQFVFLADLQQMLKLDTIPVAAGNPI